MKRIFEYVESNTDGDPVYFRCTEDYILETYWPWWRDRMTEKGDVPCEFITKERCIDDWVTIHYAEEIK